MLHVMLLTSKWSCPLRHFVLKMFLCLSLDTHCLGPSVWYQYYTGHSCFARLCLSPFNLSSNENCCRWTGCRAILISPGHLPTLRWPQWCVLRPSWDTVSTELWMRWSCRCRRGSIIISQETCTAGFCVWGSWDSEKSSDLLKVTKVIIIIARTRTRASGLLT